MADINDAGQGRTPASLPGRRTSRRPQPEVAGIELLKRWSQGEVAVRSAATTTDSRSTWRPWSADESISEAQLRVDFLGFAEPGC